MVQYILKTEWNVAPILDWLEAYEQLGPMPGISMTMLEAFLPMLPLVAILVANAAAYGLWLGFLYSWIGVCCGAFLVFYLSRRYGRRFAAYINRRFPKSQWFFRWLKASGFTPLFVLSCFPFTPSFIINILAGLSSISPRLFMIAVFSGKAVMIFIVSLAGHDLAAMLREPIKLLWVVLLFTVLWAVGRWWQARYYIG